jgi:hypothetical protein
MFTPTRDSWQKAMPPPLGAEILPSGWLFVKVIIVITSDKKRLSVCELLLDWSDHSCSSL